MRELPGGQQGDKWMEHRCGRITASRMNDLTAYSKRNKDEELEARRKYRFELLAERLTKREQNNRPPTMAMQWGIDNESRAKQAYELLTGEMVSPVGFVLHPTYDFSGASPDGLLEEAILEVKCPESTTFLKWRFFDGVPEEHQKQMQWQMACTERKKGIFLAYDPRQPEPIRFFIRELERDDKLIAELEYEAMTMNAEVEGLVATLGLPPTEWDVTGNPVIHLPELAPYDDTKPFADQCDFLDSGPNMLEAV